MLRKVLIKVWWGVMKKYHLIPMLYFAVKLEVISWRIVKIIFCAKMSRMKKVV